LKLLKGSLPTSGTLTNHVRLREVLDKGKAAMVTVHVETRDKETGEALVESQSTVVLRGSGGFGGKKNGSGRYYKYHRLTKDRGNATALNDPPKRKPDAVVEEKTTLEQAAIYRLSGDYNPLHIDPDFSGMGGFPKPSTFLEDYSPTPSNGQFFTACARLAWRENTSSRRMARTPTSRFALRVLSFLARRS
jgi:multifunctional beta-oxidation protein